MIIETEAYESRSCVLKTDLQRDREREKDKPKKKPDSHFANQAFAPRVGFEPTTN